MAEIQRGAAVVWGITTTGIAYSGTTHTGSQWISQSQESGREADHDETRDQLGEVVNRTTYNRQVTLSITVIPSSTTLSAAASQSVLPLPGTEVSVIDTDSNIGASDPGTSYECQTSGYSKTNTGKATITMTLKRWAGISAYTPVT